MRIRCLNASVFLAVSLLASVGICHGKKTIRPFRNKDPFALQEALSAGLKEIIEDGTWLAIETKFFGTSPEAPPGGCTLDGDSHVYPREGKIEEYLEAGEIVFAYKLSPPRVGFVDGVLTGNIVEIARAVVDKIAEHYGTPLEATFQPAANGNGYFEDFLVSLVDIGPLDGADVALGPLSFTDTRAEFIYYTCSFTTINFSFVRSGLEPEVTISQREDLGGLKVSALAGSTEEFFLNQLSESLATPIDILSKSLAADVLAAASGGASSEVHAALLNSPAALTYANDNADTCECFPLDFTLLDEADADRIAFATPMSVCATFG